MTMQVRTGRVSFKRFKGSGPRTTREEVTFSGPVTQVVTLLRGFDVAFSRREDQHLGKLEVGELGHQAVVYIWKDSTKPGRSGHAVEWRLVSGFRISSDPE
jgi:hypothetical protein